MGCLLTLLAVSFSSAQQRYYDTPSSHSMIQSLRGNGGHSHGHSRMERSIEYSPHVQPKGCSAHSHGNGSVCYEVDCSCQLCTDQIRFLKNCTELADRRSYDYLYNLACALKSPDLRYQRFVIEGHASAEGSYGVNLTLSQRRANAIFDYLVSHGVNPSRLMSVGYGESQARYPSSSPEHLRASDRRVMIFKVAG